MVVKLLETPEAFKAALEGSGVVIVDFYADWCGPCKFIGPHLEELSDKAENQGIAFFKVDVDNEAMSAFVEAQGISAMPTIRVYSKSETHKDELVGADKAKLEAMIEKAKA